jgi:hypothetical protein
MWLSPAPLGPTPPILAWVEECFVQRPPPVVAFSLTLRLAEAPARWRHTAPTTTSCDPCGPATGDNPCCIVSRYVTCSLEDARFSWQDLPGSPSPRVSRCSAHGRQRLSRANEVQPGSPYWWSQSSRSCAPNGTSASTSGSLVSPSSPSSCSSSDGLSSRRARFRGSSTARSPRPRGWRWASPPATPFLPLPLAPPW